MWPQYVSGFTRFSHANCLLCYCHWCFTMEQNVQLWKFASSKWLELPVCKVFLALCSHCMLHATREKGAIYKGTIHSLCAQGVLYIFLNTLFSLFVFAVLAWAGPESLSPLASSWKGCVMKAWLISSKRWRCSEHRGQLWSKLRWEVTESRTITCTAPYLDRLVEF